MWDAHKFCKRSFHSLRHDFVSGLPNNGVAPPEQCRKMNVIVILRIHT
jgi:hypothetical protein